MNPLLLNRFAIQCAISKPSLSYEQIGLIPTLPSVWHTPYNLMVFQGGKLHLFYTSGSYAGDNDTARYLMDGTQEYMVQDISGSERGYQVSTDGEYIYVNNYDRRWLSKLNPETYNSVISFNSGMRRECFANPFDKKVSVMNHNTNLKVLDITTDSFEPIFNVGSVPFANYAIFRCAGGLSWWVNTNIYCYDEVANLTASFPYGGVGLEKSSTAPYFNGVYRVQSSDRGICHFWLEDGVIHFEQQLHIKLGLENLGTGFGTGKSWGVQVDPEDKNSLIFISIVDGKIYRVKNLPKNSAY